jgi:hypothetical protein
MKTIEHFIIGSSSIASIQLIDQLPLDPGSIETLLKTIIQVAVGIATIYHMFKKKKK